MLDDAAFASQWVESRDRARPRGERALRSELLQRGVDRTTVDAVLAERRDGTESSADDPGSEGEVAGHRSPDSVAAARLLERRGRTIARGSDQRTWRQRAYGLLVRNGFDSSTATDAAARWTAGLSAETGREDLSDEADQEEPGPPAG